RPGAGPPGGGPARAHPARSADPPPGGTHGLGTDGLGTDGLGTDGVGADAGRTVTAPVRIADAETVRLLRPGDRVDVIAAGDPATDGTARVLARGARVSRVPQPVTGGAAQGEAGTDWAGADGAGRRGTESGALVALRVPRATAARLAGASATTRLAVTLW
ncbi:RcpC/CpaB family pilus assembly protein, partial [Streptomyces similanensis]|uniref:RcpC/CpaB family pilus assembly protein n=1 Tax=Streptomyces similanensis TaxID=1274988 RepID=UPI0031F183FE